MEAILVVRCACGWETRGAEGTIVPLVREHGRRVHNMDASREQVLAMAIEDPRTARGIILDAHLLADERATLGEGPLWDERTGRIMWIDILGRALLSTDPRSGATTRLELPLPVGVVVRRASGGFVAALEDGFYAVGDDGATERLVAVEADDPRTRFNDGACDPQGRFWAGTMGWGAEPGMGTLYRLDPGGGVHRVLEGVTISNGLGWSPDGTTMYYSDSGTGRVDAFDFDPVSGAVARRRPFVTVDPAEGVPDGLCVDEAGAVWLATWGGWMVRRYLPDGSADATVRVAAAHTSSCAFGGPDLADLYITTARENLGAEALAGQPTAGGLFRVRPGVRGLARAAFGG